MPKVILTDSRATRVYHVDPRTLRAMREKWRELVALAESTTEREIRNYSNNWDLSWLVRPRPSNATVWEF